jgi:DNA (cytosine-5)-methyltransferase 1
MDGLHIKEQRLRLGLSQSKLAEVAGIEQARISAFELGKIKLKQSEIDILKNKIENLDERIVKKIRKKRYQDLNHLDSIIAQRPRRNYEVTNRNKEYLSKLKQLERHFMKPEKRVLKAMSFFAGCGGLCYGVRAAGFEIVATNELVEEYKDIYKANFRDANFLTNDVCEITNIEIDRVLKEHGKIDIMVGGPPCQGFSLAGKRDVNDKRNTLFEYYLKIADRVKPKVILIENVKLLTSMKDPNGRFVRDRILETFADMGYLGSFFNVNAKDYGVPQHRERVIFIAVKKSLKKAPDMVAPMYSKSDDLFDDFESHFSFGDAVSDLEFIESGEKSSKDVYHKAVSHPEHVIRWLVEVPQGRSAHDNEDINLRPPSGYNTTYKRQVWHEPAGTVATTFGMISGCRNVHPYATRALTIREALRLQSFPDSFKLVGNDGAIRTVIGNAVPPLLAFEIAKFIRDTYML